MEGWGSASGVCLQGLNPSEPDHDDLHPRVEPGRLSCAESGRHALGTGATPTLGLAVQIRAFILDSATLLDLALRRLRLSLVVTVPWTGLRTVVPAWAHGLGR